MVGWLFITAISVNHHFPEILLAIVIASAFCEAIPSFDAETASSGRAPSSQ
jgi:hypothetical protein